jgi:small GTP-binding protein
MTTNPQYNILVIGNSGVGKTSIINRFINNYFTEKLISVTFGVSNHNKPIKLSDNDEEKISLNVIDTDGNVKTNSTSFKNACKTANGVIIVYDITNLNSFNNVSEWLKKIKEYNIMDDTVIFLIGNKSDKKKRQVKDYSTTNEIILLNTELKLYETSAKENPKVNSIDHIFNYIAKQIKSADQKSRPEPSCCSIS